MTIKQTVDLPQFKSDWLAYKPMVQICVNHTISRDQAQRIKTFLQLPARRDKSKSALNKVTIKDPSRAEISVRAAAIRAQWSEETERKRRVQQPQTPTASEVDISYATDEHYWFEERGGDQ